jgi:hypothetical protein
MSTRTTATRRDRAEPSRCSAPWCPYLSREQYCGLHAARPPESQPAPPTTKGSNQ